MLKATVWQRRLLGYDHDWSVAECATEGVVGVARAERGAGAVRLTRWLCASRVWHARDRRCPTLSDLFRSPSCEWWKRIYRFGRQRCRVSRAHRHLHATVE